MTEILDEISTGIVINYFEGRSSQQYSHLPGRLEKLPIPDVSAEQSAPVVALVDKILDAERKYLERKGSRLEKKLDKEVTALYGVEDEE